MVWAMAPARAKSIQRYARIAGVLFGVSIIAGGFGEFWIPSRLIASGSVTATAHNIATSDWLFRAGFAGYLVEACCDIGLTMLLYVLLRPVSSSLALLAVFFRLVATATFFFSEFFYFSASPILAGGDYLRSFSPEQLNTLAFLSIKLYGYGTGIASLFYGVASVVIGYLIFESGYLPRVLGVLLALSGFGFVFRSFALVLAPAYASTAVLLLVGLAGLALTLWLLVRGVDLEKWQERQVRLSDVSVS
jgi:hypothetical protein